MSTTTLPHTQTDNGVAFHDEVWRKVATFYWQDVVCLVFAWCDMIWVEVARHGIARYGVARYGAALVCMALFVTLSFFFVMHLKGERHRH